MSAFGAFRHRSYRLYFSGFLISLIGVWMQRVAQSWLVLELTDSAFWVGAVDAMAAAPMLLFTLYAGTLADRIVKRQLVIVTQAVAAIAAIILAAFTLGAAVTLWHVVTVAVIIGTANAFGLPARQALIAEMVGPSDLTSAIALNSSAFNASRMIGPAVAGVVVATVGIGVCFLANGVSYLAIILALLAIRSADLMHEPNSTRGTGRAMREGLDYVLRTPHARLLITNIAVFSVFALPMMVLMPIVARDVLGGGAVEYGWLMSTVGLGAIVGALMLAAAGHRMHRGRILGAATTGVAVTTLMFSAQQTLGLAMVALGLFGFAMVVMTALTNTLLQALAPDVLRGRVISFYAFAFLGLSPFGALQVGVVAEHFGPMAAIAFGGFVMLLAALRVTISPALRTTR
jgi:MFS family permease